MLAERISPALSELAYLSVLDEANLVGEGNDSNVYRFENRVFKIYRRYKNSQVIPEKLLLYQALTNQAQKLAETEGLSLELPFSRISYPVRINPYTELFYQPRVQRWVGVSPYVGGKTLSDIKKTMGGKELKFALCDLSTKLSQSLGVPGIAVVPVNVKYPDQAGGWVCITDLCSEVEKLNV